MMGVVSLPTRLRCKRGEKEVAVDGSFGRGMIGKTISRLHCTNDHRCMHVLVHSPAPTGASGSPTFFPT
jgi:hypothetical protein